LGQQWGLLGVPFETLLLRLQIPSLQPSGGLVAKISLKIKIIVTKWPFIAKTLGNLINQWI
jgi:hypothetical protein